MKICFVCLGNICRSPLLEQMFSTYALEHGFDCETDSAGLLNHNRCMSEGSQKVLKERGLCPKEHCSKLLTQELVSSSDLVITMTEVLKAKVIEHFGCDKKVFSLSDERLLNEEVADPYGLGDEEYFKVGAQFDRALPIILNLAKSIS